MPVLPSGRNTNYTPASPVKSADLNDLQDCIIGRKFPSTPIYLSGHSWIVTQSGASLGADGVWTLASSSQISHQIQLAPGTRITSLQFSVNRNSIVAGGQLDLRLTTRALGGSSALVFVDGVPPGTSFVRRDAIADVLSNTPIILADETLYWLSITATNLSAAAMFDGVKIICDRL